MVDLYYTREPGDKTSNSYLISTSEMWINNSDIVEKRVNKLLNLEFDLKRRPCNPIEQTDGLRTHIRFSTVPYASFEEAMGQRALFDGWRLKGNCLKTMEDFIRWEEYSACASLCKGAGIKVTAEGAIGLLRRMFLRAYTQTSWGLEQSGTYAEMAQWLTGHGFETSDNDLRSAKRAPLRAHVIPKTQSIAPLLALLLTVRLFF